MTGLDRFRELLDAYGAEPRRWPASERVMAEQMLARDPEARTLRTKAAGIDGLLDRATPLSPPIIDAEIVIGAITANSQSPAAEVVTLRPAGRAKANTFWLKVGSLVAAAMIGFLLGVTQLMNPGDATTPTSGLELADVSPW
jgi:hypothetical protein